MEYNRNEIADPKQFFRTTTIINLAMLIGQVLFGVMVFFLNQGKVIPAKPGDGMFLYIALALGVFGIFTGSFLYKQLMAKPGDSAALKEKLAAYQTALIIRCALSEGASLFAIVAYMLTGNQVLLLLVGLNVFYFIWIRPTKQKMEDELKLTYEDKTELGF